MDLATVLVEVADISLDPPRRPWGRAAVPGPGLRCPPYFASLMARCCMNDPEQRPAFAEIAHEVALLDVSSIVDSMLAKANDSLLQETLLHNVVRSSAVVRIPSSFFPETPRRGLTLTLARLASAQFPPRVAKALKEGKTVEPEHYSEVTIFFCGERPGATALSPWLIRLASVAV